VPLRARQRDCIRRAITVILVGACGELLAFSRAIDEAAVESIERGSRDDLQRAIKLAHLLTSTPADIESLLGECRASARRMIRQERAAVHRVARALLEEGQLTGPRIRQLRREAPSAL
jgi:hypothetical protein